VRVGREGFNGTLSGSADALRSFAEHLKDFDRHFEETDFKFIDGLTSDKHFKDLKVVPVQVKSHISLSLYTFDSLSPPPLSRPIAPPDPLLLARFTNCFLFSDESHRSWCFTVSSQMRA
jgi:hypothetical protein